MIITKMIKLEVDIDQQVSGYIVAENQKIQKILYNIISEICESVFIKTKIGIHCDKFKDSSFLKLDIYWANQEEFSKPIINLESHMSHSSDLSSSSSKLINPYPSNSYLNKNNDSNSVENLEELDIKLTVSKQILAKIGCSMAFIH